MSKKNQDLIIKNEIQIDGLGIFERVANIIETRKLSAGSYVNREITLMY